MVSIHMTGTINHLSLFVARSMIRPRRPSYHPLAPDRHRELYDGTLRHIGGLPQSPAVRLDNPAADRQPQAQALRLGRIEGLEQPVEVLRIDPRARIAYRNQDLCRGHELR